MPIYAIRRTENQIFIERHYEGGDLWLALHPDRIIDEPIIISFNKPFDEILDSPDDYILLGATPRGRVEVIIFRDGEPKQFSTVAAQDVPQLVEKLEVDYATS
jgi:hypothetical protein